MEFASDIKAISFDLWATLIRGNSSFTVPRVRLLLSETGCVLQNGTSILRESGGNDIDDLHLELAFKASKGFYDKLSEITGKDYGLVPRLEAIFAEIDLKAWPQLDNDTVGHLEQLLRAARLKPQFMPTLIEPNLIKTLQYLKYKGYRIGLLSNTGMESHVVMRPTIEALGLLDQFDVTMFSSEDGRAKPNCQLYIDMADKLGVLPHEVLHIGDSRKADYWGSHNAGFQPLLFAKPGTTIYPYTSSIEWVSEQLKELSSQSR